MSYRDREAALLARVHALETELAEERKGKIRCEELEEEYRSLKMSVAALSRELHRFRPRVPSATDARSLFLLLCDPDGRRREQIVPGDKGFQIGTANFAEVQLRDSSASGEHATVETLFLSERLVRAEIVSNQGNVIVNKVKIKRHILKNGDVLELGETVIVVGL